MAYLFAHLLFSLFNTSFSDFTGRTCFFAILGFLNAESIKTTILRKQQEMHE
jgi:peptidoglycan/LPS O-acetylase OafA/YrhL